LLEVNNEIDIAAAFTGNPWASAGLFAVLFPVIVTK
jgi:hypothetical protein